MRSQGSADKKRKLGILVALLPLLWIVYTFILNSILLNTESQDGNGSIIRTLISLGADVNTVDNRRTPLIYAIEQQRIQNANVLISCGADVNFPERESKITPLMVAASYSQMPVVNLLIRRGADINARDSSGVSVLGWAEKGQAIGFGAEAVTLLKKLGAVK